jgi:hypothetical protein
MKSEMHRVHPQQCYLKLVHCTFCNPKYIVEVIELINVNRIGDIINK